MNDGLLKLERQCKRRMNRLVKVATTGSAKDRRKVNELWTNREPVAGKMHRKGDPYPCTVTTYD